MGARHRRQVGGNSGRDGRLGTPQGGGDTVGIALEDTPRGAGDTSGIALEDTPRGAGDTSGIALEDTRRGAGDTSGIALEDTRRGGGNTVGITLEDTPRRRSVRFSIRRRRSDVAHAEGGIAGYNWVWKRGWHLDRTKAERLAYYMKTRYISVAVASVGLRMAGMISSPAMIFTLTAAAGGMGWAAEYIKHRNGSQGLSITLGIRIMRWVVTPWFDATPRV